MDGIVSDHEIYIILEYDSVDVKNRMFACLSNVVT
jgi:hypothetical protein